MVEDHRIVLEFSNGHIRLECSERDWYEVHLDGGRQGWVEREAFE